MSTLDRINEIEQEMARTQKNKATNAHLGRLKAKLAKLKTELVSGSKSGGGGGGGEGFDVKATGNARVGLIGFPSVGKSTLLNKLTGTFSETAAYEFTTLTCVPGVYTYKGAKVQVLDLPGIIEGAKDGKGRGKQVISVAMTCSLILICLDVTKPLTQKRKIEHELEGFGMRLNKKEPNIIITKSDKGGINITVAPGYRLIGMDEETVVTICKEFRITNASIVFRCNASSDDLIDVIEGGRKYVPCLYVMNKIDSITIEELDVICKCPHYVPISADLGWNIDGLKDKMWDYMDLIRVYTKPKGQVPDYSEPVILPREKSTMEDFCLKLHKSILDEFKYALVWGMSVKHNPQRVGKDHVLVDEDVVQIVKTTG
ncbi:GTP-binding protein [Perkinsus olseni]|uniref:GTP-binding protein n=2 Tax=Perkinsus olseni TaxID=32597 RepID=A0A7J6LWF1_PEROL|nr:GTP-binding protein [Perkinsus olseni]KAF4669764.1 GTP-binding protein [Perkinsus olseni]KAF4684397.1 GTP-binding protein [Perkinsus olseni]